METTYFEKINEQAMNLFNQIRQTLENSKETILVEKAKLIPTTLSNAEKPINVVFAGQYSAGKSSILKIITGKDLATGGGITTEETQTFEWNGIRVTDTPGIHTQNRPDHDAITYEALAKADLIVFVVTNEGFSSHLASHFRKLIFDKGKGHEMMLVVNKMDKTSLGNTPEQQQVLIEKDILPVISPYSVDDFYTSFLSLDAYELSQAPKYAKHKEELILSSGIDKFIENINRFVADKGLLGSYTTALYQVEKILSDILSEMRTGDPVVDGTIHVLEKKRRILEESKSRILEQTKDAIVRKRQEIAEYGNELANDLSDSSKEEEVNQQLQQKQNETERLSSELGEEIANIINVEETKLQGYVEDFSDSQFVNNLKEAMKQRIQKIKISAKTQETMQKVGGVMQSIGDKIAQNALGAGAGKGFTELCKLKTYSGSNVHKAVLWTGKHVFHHKFSPWQAVKWTKNISTASRVLGVVGTGLNVALQFYNEKQEDKALEQLAQGRNELRTCFLDVSKAVELNYDKATDTWLEENITPLINDVDKNLQDIQDKIRYTTELHEKLSIQVNLVRQMISNIQTRNID